MCETKVNLFTYELAYNDQIYNFKDQKCHGLQTVVTFRIETNTNCYIPTTRLFMRKSELHLTEMFKTKTQ